MGILREVFGLLGFLVMLALFFLVVGVVLGFALGVGAL
jgi:hypothetical protein